MLLGPEKIPAVGGVFLVAVSGLDRLTHPWGLFSCVGVVVVVVGWGVVVC
jgi:hypothetical protein